MVNIFVYGTGISNAYREELTSFINPDGKDTREFIIKPVTYFTALKEAAGIEPALFILADMDKKDNENVKLLNLLIKSNMPYICIDTTEGNIQETGKKLLLAAEKTLDLGFTLHDFAQIYKHDVAIDKISHQLLIFKNGIPKTILKKPAMLNDGILPLTENCITEYAAEFDNKKDNFKLMKFVPASGAATRMFKSLCEFIAEFDPEKDTINAYINRNRKKGAAISVFLVGMDKLPFYDAIMKALREDPHYTEWNKDVKRYKFISTLLNDKRFDYANKPKGILPFHRYGNFIATPIYEHLKESVTYGASQQQSHIHFTISEEHLDGFLDSIKEVKEIVEKESGTTISVDFSYQKKSTDTLAVDLNNKPFRDDSGNLLFRPGGHGALIENLGNLDADIVFIKNIDNVSHNHIETIALYKKALAGILVKLQEKVYEYLAKLEQSNITETELSEIFTFAKEKLSLHTPDDVAKYTFEHRIGYAQQLLNRPIRVCGMVKNEGEPGGGPFWVKTEKGRLSLQIVESSQIDLDNKTQEQVFANATHFNPVDLVCSLKNYKGEYFNLSEFVDEGSGFIVYKNRMGKDVKSYELPGLWNGAMAGWITVFVEVPLDTFNPVKTVTDLLKPAHQPQ